MISDSTQLFLRKLFYAIIKEKYLLNNNFYIKFSFYLFYFFLLKSERKYT